MGVTVASRRRDIHRGVGACTRIVFTGGSGEVGRRVVARMIARGHRGTTFDRVPLHLAGVLNRTGDPMQPGDAWSALRRRGGFAGLAGATPPAACDAVVHFAANRRRKIFAHVDAGDLGRTVACCLRADGPGVGMFNVANPDSSVDRPTAAVVARVADGIDVRRAVTRRETLHAIDKARRPVGGAPQARWAPGGGRRGAAAAP